MSPTHPVHFDKTDTTGKVLYDWTNIYVHSFCEAEFHNAVGACANLFSNLRKILKNEYATLESNLQRYEFWFVCANFEL